MTMQDIQVCSWEENIRAMEREWGEIAARRTKPLLAEWHKAMAEMCCQHDRLVSDGRWLTGPSDFLDIVGLARHENTHSRMLAWLLTPTARHGLGRGLVERLVKHCTGEPASAPLAVKKAVFAEWRNGREADVVVYGRNFTLVIENKVDASEQDSQCDDLFKSFKSEKAPLFLFLTPDGRKPRTATTQCSRQSFRTVSWPEVRAMLETLSNESRPTTGVEPAVDVVSNYIRTLREQFG